MSNRVRAAVKALIEEKGKVLVLKAELDETYWLLPGGKIEYGESPLEALERELREEIGKEAKIGEIVGMYHFYQGKNEDGDEVVLTVYEADIDDKDSIDISSNPDEDYITEYEWITPEELAERSSNESLADLLKKRYEF